MAKLKPVLGYMLAVFSCLVAMAIGPAIGLLSEPLIKVTGLTLSPNTTGGEVKQTIAHGVYQTQVHRMVFDDTLIGERPEGFIQVNWTPLGALPAHIDEEIDANGDGQADFRVEVNTANKETALTPYAAWVLGLEGTYTPNESLMIRVRLRNPSR
jgi:hypothetical protein